mgnify:CR=1 FL=1
MDMIAFASTRTRRTLKKWATVLKVFESANNNNNHSEHNAQHGRMAVQVSRTLMADIPSQDLSATGPRRLRCWTSIVEVFAGTSCHIKSTSAEIFETLRVATSVASKYLLRVPRLDFVFSVNARSCAISECAFHGNVNGALTLVNDKLNVGKINMTIRCSARAYFQISLRSCNDAALNDLQRTAGLRRAENDNKKACRADTPKIAYLRKQTAFDNDNAGQHRTDMKRTPCFLRYPRPAALLPSSSLHQTRRRSKVSSSVNRLMDRRGLQGSQ